jgi:hypothetical protein
MTTIQGIRTLHYAPQKGQHRLSVNLALADAVTVFEMARSFGFTPEIVQIPTQSGIEIHALLVSEQAEPDRFFAVSDWLDEWCDRINSRAIRHCYGGLIGHPA